MKKLFYLFSIVAIFNFFSLSECFGNNETISFNDYLKIDKQKNKKKFLKLNKDGNVIFKKKIVLTNNGEPLNYKTAYTDNEFRVLFTAKGIKPRKGCNPTDTVTNGTLGCYIDNPDLK